MRSLDHVVVEPVRVLLICGSLRSLSTNTAVIRTAIAVAPDDVVATAYSGLGELPHFNPDDDVEPLHPAVEELRAAVRGADAVLICAPEYAGALPGSFKNVLDWLIGDDQSGSIYRKPAAWINASPRGAAGAHDELRRVLGYASADIVERACAHVAVSSSMVGADGTVVDDGVRQAIARTLGALADHVRHSAVVTNGT